MDKQSRVTVGVTGGVAAYKAAELVRALQQHALDVQVVMTRAAMQFIQPLTFSSLTGHKVISGLWEPDAEGTGALVSGLDEQGQIEHIAEAQATDALVIAPATTHVLAKLAHGLADDFLTTLALATTAPVLVAPAMNVNMWNHPATQDNLRLLQARGVIVVSPGSGYLACGMTGEGRLASIEEITSAVLAAIAGGSGTQSRDFTGETILITAGGTREAIDPVRFLGNRSSGKMGYALAEAAEQRGARVLLVSAPTALSPPERCSFSPVTSAEEMRAAVMEHLPGATIVIGAAAVADFRAAAFSSAKIRRTGALHIELEPTEDIIRSVSQSVGTRPTGDLPGRPRTLVIAFAAETDTNIEHAREKLLSKGADAIVVNDISRPGLGFDSDANAAAFVTAALSIDLPPMSKRALADRILTQVLLLRQQSKLATSEQIVVQA